MQHTEAFYRAEAASLSEQTHADCEDCHNRFWLEDLTVDSRGRNVCIDCAGADLCGLDVDVDGVDLCDGCGKRACEDCGGCTNPKCKRPTFHCECADIMGDGDGTEAPINCEECGTAICDNCDECSNSDCVWYECRGDCRQSAFLTVVQASMLFDGDGHGDEDCEPLCDKHGTNVYHDIGCAWCADEQDADSHGDEDIPADLQVAGNLPNLAPSKSNLIQAIHDRRVDLGLPTPQPPPYSSDSYRNGWGAFLRAEKSHPHANAEFMTGWFAARVACIDLNNRNEPANRSHCETGPVELTRKVDFDAALLDLHNLLTEAEESGHDDNARRLRGILTLLGETL